MGSIKYSALAIIPARGGSKRLPRKNLLELDGKPLIAHSIEAAYASGCFQKIIVSSDDVEILDIAEKYKAIPYLRKTELAGDSVPTAPVLLDVIEHEHKKNQKWDRLACLYATAPLRNAQDVQAVLNLLSPGVCDFAMATCKATQPIHQALEMNDSGTLLPLWPDMLSKNSQDAPQYVFGNGSTYAVNVPAFMEHKTLYGPNLRGYIMPRRRSVDIDTDEDFALVKYYATQDS